MKRPETGVCAPRARRGVRFYDGCVLICYGALLAGCGTIDVRPTEVNFREAAGAEAPRAELAQPLAIPDLNLPYSSGAEARHIPRWCDELAGDDAHDRERARMQLESAGEAAVPALRGVAAGPDVEAAAAATAIVDRIRFGDVGAASWSLLQDFGQDDPLGTLLVAPVDPRLMSPEGAALMQGLAEALRRGAGRNHDRDNAAFLSVLLGPPEGLDALKRRAKAGLEDASDDAVMTVLAKIVRGGLRMSAGATRSAAIEAAAALGVRWRAALFHELAAIALEGGADAQDAIEIVALAARDGAVDIARFPRKDLPGPLMGPSSVAPALRPETEILLSIAEDRSRPLEIRALALEAVSWSCDAAANPRIEALEADMPEAVMEALIHMACPECNRLVLAAIGGDARFDPEAAIGFAARSRNPEALPLLRKLRESGDADEALVTRAICEIAGEEQVEEIVAMAEAWTPRVKAKIARPVMGALVRLAPVFDPDRQARARRALAAALEARSANVRFLAACALSALDGRAGIAAWGSRLDDRGELKLEWPGARVRGEVRVYAAGSLQQLTGTVFEESHAEDFIEAWKAWWKEHRAEYEEAK